VKIKSEVLCQVLPLSSSNDYEMLLGSPSCLRRILILNISYMAKYELFFLLLLPMNMVLVNKVRISSGHVVFSHVLRSNCGRTTLHNIYSPQVIDAEDGEKIVIALVKSYIVKYFQIILYQFEY
jgi:hypothetical protein